MQRLYFLHDSTFFLLVVVVVSAELVASRHHSLLLGSKRSHFIQRSLEERKDKMCADCSATLPEQECSTFYVPVTDYRKEQDCYCLTGYNCCKQVCDLAVERSCAVGHTYNVEEKDCCGCQVYNCEPCQPPDDEATTSCNAECKTYRKEHHPNSATQCWESGCADKNVTSSMLQRECDARCQEEIVTTQCDQFNLTECRVKEVSDCKPEAPPPDSCSTVAQMQIHNEFYYNVEEKRCDNCWKWDEAPKQDESYYIDSCSKGIKVTGRSKCDTATVETCLSCKQARCPGILPCPENEYLAGLDYNDCDCPHANCQACPVFTCGECQESKEIAKVAGCSISTCQEKECPKKVCDNDDFRLVTLEDDDGCGCPVEQCKIIESDQDDVDVDDVWSDLRLPFAALG